MRVFIDSNIPMYVAGARHPNREPARRFLERVRSGEVDGCASTEVLQEILYRYAALERLDLAVGVYDLFVEICPEIFDVSLADTDKARDLLGRATAVSARDAIHAAVALNHGVETVASFDRGFDRIPGLARLEPS